MFEKFDKAHEEAKDGIKKYLASTKEYDQETVHLLKWLLNTSHNPYSIFVDECWAGALGTASGFHSLCNMIHHALVDDGEISFVQVENSDPQIAFVWKHEDNIEKYVCNEWQLKRGVDKKDIKFFKDAYEFTQAHDEYKVQWLKKCFMCDAESHSLEIAVMNYQNTYPYFDTAWIEEFNNN